MKKENIVIRHLCKQYEGKKVLNNASFDFPKGQTTCIMAPSGKGKTTLLRILMGLEQADEGTILGMEGLKKSAVFQEDRLCENLSASANIRLVSLKKIPGGKQQEIKDIHEAMEEIGLSGCEDQPARELSGGMRRRVALLRALYADWDILFLDEPFKGLDEETKEKAIAYTKKCCQGKTVIFVTHDKREAQKMGDSICPWAKEEEI